MAAICAAPLVYGKRGLLKGKKATCYPGFDQYLEGAEYTGNMVEVTDNFILGKGPEQHLHLVLPSLKNWQEQRKFKR